MSEVIISACGMTTAIGLTAPAACAAFRARFDNFAETRFISRDGDWVLGAEVPLEEGWRGVPRFAKLLAGPVRECLDAGDGTGANVPILLCLSEETRAGRASGLEQLLLLQLKDELDHDLHPDSRAYAFGQVGGVVALRDAKALIEAGAGQVIVAGVDGYLNAASVREFGAADRLLTATNSNGFILGEAGAAVLLQGQGKGLRLCGIGFGAEKATIDSGEPLRADGMVTAMAQALGEAGLTYEDISYRLADIAGEQFYFREAALAQSRLWRGKRDPEDVWLPCDGMGQTGAAVIPICLGVALTAARKAYAPGPIALIHAAHDDGRRAAIVTKEAA